MTKNYFNLKRLYTLVALLWAASLVFIPSAHGATSDELIKLPAGTVEGRLPNGLKYIILPNKFPEKKAEFRLVWKVGAVQQDDNQGGCAHFLEHMAFGGSENFPNRGAVAYLESLGMKYGIDINAYTGHDRTIYMFALPTDSLESNGYSQPLEIIADWMARLTINPARVETEKGIILEELRSSFQDDPFYNLKIGQNRFSSRMPLGTPEEVKRVTADVLEAFYRKWYLPQFGTIVVVGDVDPREVEKEIKRKFAFLKKTPDPGFVSYPLTYSPARQIQIEADTLNNQEQVEIIIPHPTIVTTTLGDVRRKAIGRVVIDALSYRMSQRGMSAEISDNWYLGNSNHFVLKAREGREHGVDSCIVAMASEIRGILDKGFGKEEIAFHAEKAAQRTANSAHTGYSSVMWCEDFADYALSGDRYLSDPKQTLKAKELIASISAEEAQAVLREWINHSDTMLVAVNTTPDKAPVRTLDSILALWQKGLDNPANDYTFAPPAEKEVELIATPEFLKKSPKFRSSAIKSKREYASLGIRELRLTNGIRLLLKPTLDDGDVMFAMLAPGGYADVPVKDRPLYSSTGSYIDMGGIAKMPNQFGEFMYQNEMALGIALETNWHGFLGSFGADKATEFFNVVYEKITDPELRYDDFDEIKQSMLEEVGHEDESVLAKMLERAPDRKLMARLDELMCNVLDTKDAYAGENDVLEARRRNIEKLSLDSIAAFYRELYSRPDDCVFVICGNFDADKVAKEFVPVFSQLRPAPERRINYSALSLPQEIITERFPNGNESQTEFDYIYFGEYESGLRNSLVLKLMSNILRNHVIDELREKRALVYSPYVMLNYEGLPRNYYYFDINSSSDNAKMPEVRKALDYVLNDLRTNAVSATELESIRRACLIAKRDALTPYSPSSWRTTLLSLLKNNESIEDFDRYESIISSITPQELQEAFNKYINPDLYVMLYMSDEDIAQ